MQARGSRPWPVVATLALGVAAAVLFAGGVRPAFAQAQPRPPRQAPAPPQRPAPPPRSAAQAAKPPEVTVAGVQVVSAKVKEDDWSAKPFNSDNGAKLVLLIKMPAGVGLIDIDEDASVLDAFSDDAETDLDGKFESFPKEFKDGTGGTFEIRSARMPAPTATVLTAEGTIVLQTAAGTKPTKVANVSIANDKTFKLGTTTITVAEVQTEEDGQTFTLKLPRQVLASIKEVTFADAKGQPVEGRRTSSGYFNDNAELGFSVKSTAKTLTLEFEQWQGLREIKVPFKVRAGLSLAP